MWVPPGLEPKSTWWDDPIDDSTDFVFFSYRNSFQFLMFKCSKDGYIVHVGHEWFESYKHTSLKCCSAQAAFWAPIDAQHELWGSPQAMGRLKDALFLEVRGLKASWNQCPLGPLYHSLPVFGHEAISLYGPGHQERCWFSLTRPILLI